ncbi:MAG: hypothetical protein ABSD52_10215 [Candidatus Cybelea sp.]|jgi:hypothetical protein
MSLEHFFYLSQIIAALAVIASLLFVALEVRNSTRESRHRAGEEAYQKFREVQLEVASNADLARIWSQGVHDFFSFQPLDRTRFLLVTHVFFKNWESIFLVHVDGRLSDEHSESTENMAGDLLGYPGIQAVWSARKRYFHQAFRAHVDAKIEAIPNNSNSVLPYEFPGRA